MGWAREQTWQGSARGRVCARIMQRGTCPGTELGVMMTEDLFLSPQHKTRLWIRRL